MVRASFGGSNKAAAAAAAAAAKTVLITGVSRGLGRSLALELSKRGHTVIGCSRSQDKLNSLQSELSSPDRHLLLNVDVSSNSSVEELARVVMEKKVVPDIIGCTILCVKVAVEGLSRAVAKEMPDGFAVVAVSPGVINTEMLQSCFGNSAQYFRHLKHGL